MRTSTMVTMKGYMPAAWRSIIKPVNKVSGVGGTSSSWSGTETVSDECFLLAEVEIFGSLYDSVSGEGSQYAYYKAGNYKSKNNSGYGGYATSWWQRSPESGTTRSFCAVTNMAVSSGSTASHDKGVAFGFCV